MGLVSSVFPQTNEMALVSPLMLCLPELQSQCQHFFPFCGPSLPCSASTALRSVQTVLLSEGGLLFLFLFFSFSSPSPSFYSSVLDGGSFTTPLILPQPPHLLLPRCPSPYSSLESWKDSRSRTEGGHVH